MCMLCSMILIALQIGMYRHACDSRKKHAVLQGHACCGVHICCNVKV